MIRKIAQQFLILVAGLVFAGPVFAQCVYITNCSLVWSDEFDGTSVDQTKWEFMIGNGGSYGIPGWGNNELQYYRQQNATVANGELTITAKQETFAGYQYTSARLRTLNKGDFKYGRMEMRAKLPTGQGMWPAFWMLPTNSPYGGWAASGEIDIMEMIGSQPDTIHGTIHYGGEWPGNQYSGSSTNVAPGTGTDWHTYAIEWQDGIIRWFVDGQLYSTRTSWYSTNGSYPAPFDVDFHMLLNLAVGGDWPGNPNGSTSFPQEYVIDYVRVYQEGGAPASSNILFDDMEHGNPAGNGWFTYQGTEGAGGIGANFADVPPNDGGSASMWAIWNSLGNAGFYGGFGRNNPTDVSDSTHFSFWINPDAGQDYNLEINLQDDDNGDGAINPADDDEFQYVCHISASGPCAVSGGGWQQIEIPLTAFTLDTSYLYGGNGVLDTTPVSQGGNGSLDNVVMSVVSNTTANATFRTDYWEFIDKIAAVIDIENSVLHPHHDGSASSPANLDDVVEVVVFGASTLVGDAEDLDTDLIDVNTLQFGPAGGNVSAGHSQEYNVDVDADGLDDARFRFVISDTGFSCSDSEGTLVGDLTSGQTFEALDTFTSDCNASCH
ncbi:MAG: family 16 glycosylhydrolase [Gammaproteobacteria bacterium]|nr:family 16 glycosylhydrolase [Gammaproteobacteria bacterium]